MLFAFYLVDRPDATALRQSVLAEHRAYLARAADRIAFAGPLLADDHQSMVGSLLVMDFDDRGAAEAWLRDEPFSRAGVYGERAVWPFRNRWPQKTGFAEA